MSRVIEINGRLIKIRALTRGETKSLKDLGFSAMMFSPTLETADKAQDKALELVLDNDDRAFLDTCPNRRAFDVFKEILKETYGDPDEEKNSRSTSAGTQTESE